jgi:hypothetical protein
VFWGTKIYLYIFLSGNRGPDRGYPWISHPEIQKSMRKTHPYYFTIILIRKDQEGLWFPAFLQITYAIP